MKRVSSLLKKLESSLNQKSIQDIFTDRYNKNSKIESRSGVGSSLSNTKEIQMELPKLFKKLKINSILDIPCGDFNWMKFVSLDNISYIGGDIVENCIHKNKTKYSDTNKIFVELNIFQDNLPKVDLIFCRDIFVHFSFDNIKNSIINIKQSNSKFLLTTSFISKKENRDIKTGEWRPLNLLAPPFSFPEPMEIINEKYYGEMKKYDDKSLLLWRISDLN